MRWLLLLFVLLAAPLCAQEQKAVSLPTEKEIAEGWIALFDGKTTFGWTSPNDSKWTVLDGMMAPQKEKPGLLVTTTGFWSYDMDLEFQIARSGDLAVLTNCDGSGKQLNGVQPFDLNAARDQNRARFQGKVRNGRITDHSIEWGGLLSGVGRGGSAPTSDAATAPGHLALKGNGFLIRKLLVKPVYLTTLLNGKDLSGWQEHPNRKSKFSVTKEGWLSLKDGPGDLQTTKQWDDFVLQLECKSNGKNLNSGVFFRCLPGEYQMGYEAQIHNGFGPEKEYTLDVFDPQTHRALDKKKVKYTALDFGTGAIYRRQPARLQASRDQEWFTMTVVAQGRHLATWVNGVQVVDWTDHRELAENARKGAYLKKGPISLQGHDPTTDLLFRNIRIAALSN